MGCGGNCHTFGEYSPVPDNVEICKQSYFKGNVAGCDYRYRRICNNELSEFTQPLTNICRYYDLREKNYHLGSVVVPVITLHIFPASLEWSVVVL